MELILIVAFLLLMVLVTIKDIKTMEIPNEYILVALGLGIISAIFTHNIPLWERFVGFLCVSLPLFLIVLAVPEAFGGGDIKLMAACGFFLGFRLTLFAFFLAVLTGGSYGIWLLLAKKKQKKEHFAFGPFLCFGMAMALLFGNTLLEFYFRRVLWI